MAVRYLFNTSGEYVAFIQDGNLFNPNGKWLGVIANGNEVYNTNGLYIGLLLDDDRVVIDKNWSIPKAIRRPSSPLKPITPIHPLKRLKMFQVPYPYRDVFENIRGTVQELIPQFEFEKFDNLIGASIFAEDGTFLGVISKNTLDQKSISNVFGEFGSPYSNTSIFNEYCPYGGQYGQMSPFNLYTTTPPKIIRDRNFIGYLTVNSYITNKIDSNHFVAWLNNK
jgi:sporulation protein YlmC with PRC-barrel domain